jgi:hypothetical protein
VSAAFRCRYDFSSSVGDPRWCPGCRSTGPQATDDGRDRSCVNSGSPCRSRRLAWHRPRRRPGAARRLRARTRARRPHEPVPRTGGHRPLNGNRPLRWCRDIPYLIGPVKIQYHWLRRGGPGGTRAAPRPGPASFIRPAEVGRRFRGQARRTAGRRHRSPPYSRLRAERSQSAPPDCRRSPARLRPARAPG